MRALKALMRTDSSTVLLVLRVGLGVVILAHGLQKALGWFGGFGFAGTMDFFTVTMGFPYLLGLAAIVTESFGAAMLIVGVLTRLWAAAIGVTMLVATLTVHAPHGFFMNWSGQQAGEGIEFFVLAMALAGALVVGGGGALSVDRAAAGRLQAVVSGPSPRV